MAEIKNSNEIKQLLYNLDENSIVTNVQTTYVITTEDKVRILYDEYSKVRKRTDNMLSWFGVFLTLFITDITCDFKDFYSIHAQTVTAFFYFCTFACAIFLVWRLIYWFKHKHELEFDYFFNKLKGGNLSSSENN